MKPVSQKLVGKNMFVSMVLLVTSLSLSAGPAHAGSEGVGSSEDFRATNAPLVWVVGNPDEPRASLIRKLPKGGVVSVLSEHGRWYRVAVIDGSGQGGYVLATLLKEASQSTIDAALAIDEQVAAGAGETFNTEGTDDDASGYRQANVPKVWVVKDPERIYETLVRKLDHGEAVRVLSQGEIWSKVQLSGTGQSGFVMNRWTTPASFTAIRRFLSAPKTKPSATIAKVHSKPSKIVSPVKAPYLVKELPKETPAPKAAPAAPPKKPKAPQIAKPQPALQLAGVGLPGLPFEGKQTEKETAEDTEENSSGMTLTLTIIFALSAIGLFALFMIRRSKYRLGDGAMDCLGKIKIDSSSVLTLVRVPGKLLVMLKTAEGVDILREIKTNDDVAPSQARQILHESFVGHLPKKPRGSRVERAASMADLSPAEALAMGAGSGASRRATSSDPLQDRLHSARARMRQVMGVS